MVKITPTGKYSIRVSAQLKGFLLTLLYTFLENLNNEVARTRLAAFNNDVRILRALIDEIFCKYHTQLSIINRDGKLVLTVAQAHALWELCQQYDQEAFMHPEMGHLLMELHKKMN